MNVSAEDMDTLLDKAAQPFRNWEKQHRERGREDFANEAAAMVAAFDLIRNHPDAVDFIRAGLFELGGGQ